MSSNANPGGDEGGLKRSRQSSTGEHYDEPCNPPKAIRITSTSTKKGDSDDDIGRVQQLETSAPSNKPQSRRSDGPSASKPQYHQDEGPSADEIARIIAAHIVPNYDDVCALTAKEMSELSNEVRQRALEELHGVIRSPTESARERKRKANDSDGDSWEVVGDESPQSQCTKSSASSKALFWKKKLQRMQIGLDDIGKLTAYEQARFLSPAHVFDPRMRRQMLRAERYKEHKAAVRLARWWQFKLSLFGLGRLLHPTCQTDLGYYLDSFPPCFQILPSTDSAGRRVYVWTNREFSKYYSSWESQIRVLWYVIEKTSRNDEMTQKNGAVLVVHNVDVKDPAVIEPSAQFVQTMNMAKRLFESVPTRFVVHYLFDDEKIKPALALLQYAIGRDTRQRFRAHFGPDHKCREMLKSFGVPVEEIPTVEGSLTDGTEYFETCLARWKREEDATREAEDALMARQRQMHEERQERQRKKKKSHAELGASDESDIAGFHDSESESSRRLSNSTTSEAKTQGSATITTVVPTPADVLLGRGRPYAQFPGNLKLCEMVDRSRAAHSLKDRREKTNISIAILEKIQANGGRFLKRQHQLQHSVFDVDDQDNSGSFPGVWFEVDDKAARKKIAHVFRTPPRRSKEKSDKSSDSWEGGVEAKPSGKKKAKGKPSTKSNKSDRVHQSSVSSRGSPIPLEPSSSMPIFDATQPEPLETGKCESNKQEGGDERDEDEEDGRSNEDAEDLWLINVDNECDVSFDDISLSEDDAAFQQS